MNDNQTLELQLKTTGEEALKILQKLTSEITGLSTGVKDISKNVKNINGINTEINKIESSTNKASVSVGKLSKAFGSLFGVMAVKRVGLKAMEFLDDATNRAEELNLFNVIFKNIEKNGEKTFSELGKSAIRFQNRLNEAFGTNMTDTLRYQGLFQAMATNQGISENYAAIMSENMVKLTYDLASLYNRTEKSTAEALRAGVYAGQTKPLRGFGIDVTQTSLNPTLQALGITDRTVNQMSQAEKQILRYITALRQAQSAMGDFADTIESPANQLKVFKQQLEEAKVAWGNLFMGMYSDLLPYANAILMILKEIAKAIGNIFGIQQRDYNTGLASTEEIYEGIADGAGNAAKAVKELNRQALSFDQIHNLQTPSKSAGSGVGGLSGGIDQRLLDAIGGYDNLMEKVKMKATEIRDRWMEILGFKKIINPLTGEVSFKYQGLKTTIKNLWNEFNKLNPQAKTFIGLLGATTIAKIITIIKKLVTALGSSGLFRSITSLFTPLKTFSGYITHAGEETFSLTTALKRGINDWHDTASGAEKLATGLKGVAANVGGLYLFKNAMDDMNKSGTNFINVAEGMVGSFATIFGAVQAGAAIGGTWGAVIGGIISVFELLITGISSFKSDYEKELEAINTSSQNLIDKHQKIKDELSESLAVPQAHEVLLNELQNIVDENGKVKKGYEDRAQFIVTTLANAYGIEIEFINGKIKNYDKEIKKIKDLIQQKQTQIMLEKSEESYNLALETKAEAYNNFADAQEKFNIAEANFRKEQDKILDMWNKMSDSEKQSYKNYEEYYNYISNNPLYPSYKKAADEFGKAAHSLNIAEKAYDENTKAIMNYQGLLSASTEGNTEKIQYYLSELEKSYAKNKDNINWTYSEQIKDAAIYYKKIIELSGESEDKVSDKTKAEAEARYNAVTQALKNEMNYVDGVSDEVAEGWYTLSQVSTEKFMENFKDLPSDVQQQVVDKMQDKGYAISDELQKGIKKINPEINIKAKLDTSNVSSNINSIISWVKKAFGGGGLSVGGSRALGGIFNGLSWSDIPQFANGGLPSHGTIFAAGENGAEIVGNINRRTEVLNRSQIASAIYSAVASAMSQYGGGTTQVELYAHTDEGVVIDRINQKTKQTGKCPINIPVENINVPQMPVMGVATLK